MNLLQTRANTTIKEQIDKIKEEVAEVEEAIANEESAERICSEILDIIQAAITLGEKFEINSTDIEIHSIKLIAYELQGKLEIIKGDDQFE